MSPDATLRYSVVVPAYNEAEFIAATLESLLAQTYAGPYEIIVVDNNCTDATPEIAARLGARVVSEPQPGVCFARQRGLAAARGEIVVSTDADTVYPPNWLEQIDAAFRSGADVVGVAGPCRYRNPSWWVKLFPRLLFGLVTGVHRLTGWVGYVTATNVAFRATAFEGYDLRLTQGGDELDVVRRVRRRGKVVWLPENVVMTSPRRQERGLLHTFFVSFLLYYLICYWLNRLSSRTVLGMAPSFRTEGARRPMGGRMATWSLGTLLALATSVELMRRLIIR
jgi:glycosyltransferase involved in cell wall biosynthesis